MQRIKFISTLGKTVIAMAAIPSLVAELGCAISSKGLKRPPQPSVNTPLPSPLFVLADNPWNTVIPKNAPIDPQSASILLAQSCGNLKGFVRVECSMPYNVINSKTDNVTFFNITGLQPDENDPATTSFPYMSWMQFQNGTWDNDPASADSKMDHHLLVVDLGTNYLYETYQLRQQGGNWVHEGAARFDLNTNARRGTGYQDSADAAGLPIVPGLIRMDEINNKLIPHALRMTLGSTLAGYISPATHGTRSFYADPPTLAPMGARFRLKLNINPNNYDPVRKVIITCLQNYGAIVADNGTNFAITAVNDNAAFKAALPPGQFYGPDAGKGDDASFRLLDLSGNDLHIDDFELIAMGPVTQLP